MPDRHRKQPAKGYHVHGYRDADRNVENLSVKNAAGEVVAKSATLPPEVASFLMEIVCEYEERFGSAPHPEMTIGEVAAKIGQRLPTPEEFLDQSVQAMKAAGIRPEFIHAFEKTGLLVSEENQHLIDDEALREWQAAVAEYRSTAH